MSKIYVDKRTYDSLLAASKYNQKIGEAMDCHKRIGLSDDECCKMIEGARICFFKGYSTPNLISECMIKYGIKKDD